MRAVVSMPAKKTFSEERMASCSDDAVAANAAASASVATVAVA